MKGVLIVVGKTTDKRFEAITNEYVERIRHYIPFDIEVIPDLKNTKGLSQSEQKGREGEQILRSLQAGDYVVLLDEHGSERSSMDFAAWMQKKMSAGPKRLVFIVGGPYGFSENVHKRGNEEISLSRMTLSHQMVRMFFAEQIYRAMTILNGEPYHHE
ncbi:MAG: 23S rRNA (pseudouridine(1915)-N(3))-methyltransferase RlmH [Bacteroidaceae bacterium]|nr:23S rRNA (pseudouridine(1915)-N(3))-methyltransferase RlmH [Bacteroidaceae bacterium]MBQ9170806.1 23S rRNA (pseudouridine(1915)-N(3))-methyltransferase RlmH [Bacteroidaceae bacterium]